MLESGGQAVFAKVAGKNFLVLHLEKHDVLSSECNKVIRKELCFLCRFLRCNNNFHAEIVEVEVGGVAIYHPFGEFRRAKIVQSPVWCSRLTTGVPLAHASMNFAGLDLTMSDRLSGEGDEAPIAAEALSPVGPCFKTSVGKSPSFGIILVPKQLH
ncbi:hypothetical protein TNCV_4712421 [Trichonephila clavipes]|nr:hypothetical protein TNCV_4712421 [Trichonephila clavipes]